jgi:hypothetical protein
MSPRAARLSSLALAYLLGVAGLSLLVLGAGPRPPQAVAEAAAAVARVFAAPASTALPSSADLASAPVDGGAVTPGPSGPGFATRVVVPDLGVDLPIVSQSAGYPYCNVAMYFGSLGKPGLGKATYVYDHARAGMFGPIYDLATTGHEGQMLGMTVDLYSSADRRFTYRIVEVRIHQISMADPLSATTEQLWLQTSEGGPGTPGKTQVIADLISSAPVSAADAAPTPHPVACG